MALKIKKQIGTSKGIVENTYLRIDSYKIDKNSGTLTIEPNLYSSELSASHAASFVNMGDHFSLPHIPKNFFHITEDIDNTYNFKLTSSYSEEYIENEVTQSRTVSVVDLTPITGSSIFEYAYPKLKEKLETTFGSGSIEDC